MSTIVTLVVGLIAGFAVFDILDAPDFVQAKSQGLGVWITATTTLVGAFLGFFASTTYKDRSERRNEERMSSHRLLAVVAEMRANYAAVERFQEFIEAMLDETHRYHIPDPGAWYPPSNPSLSRSVFDIAAADAIRTLSLDVATRLIHYASSVSDTLADCDRLRPSFTPDIPREVAHALLTAQDTNLALLRDKIARLVTDIETDLRKAGVLS